MSETRASSSILPTMSCLSAMVSDCSLPCSSKPVVCNSVVMSLSVLGWLSDRVNGFDDSEVVDYDAEIEGSVWLAPGTVWAHSCCSQGRHIAVLPLPLCTVPRGRVPVTVADRTIEISFVTDESEHVDFFRSLISLEDADEAKFRTSCSVCLSDAQVGRRYLVWSREVQPFVY